MEVNFYFIVVAVVVSVYQAYRGFGLQWVLANRATWRTTVNTVLLLCIADAFFYLVCSALGFFALYLAHHLLFHGPSLWELSASTLAFIGVLVFVGVTGITAQLPALIQRLKPRIPGVSSE